MEIGNCSLALGGDPGNTIKKFSVTPTEVAVLQVLHGEDAVSDIEITGDVARGNREERERIVQNYGKRNGDGTMQSKALDSLFPGIAAPLFQRFVDLELNDGAFVVPPKRLQTPAAADSEAGASLAQMTLAQLKAVAAERGVDITGAKGKAAVLEALEAASEPEDEDDGEMDIADQFSEKPNILE